MTKPTLMVYLVVAFYLAFALGWEIYPVSQMLTTVGMRTLFIMVCLTALIDAFAAGVMTYRYYMTDGN